jgi:hypothetical protein
LLKQKQLHLAFKTHNQSIFYPEEVPEVIINDNMKQSYLSLDIGLELVANNDSRKIIIKNNLPYLHLVGEKSLLVNSKNVIMSARGKLVIVPNGSMRVLQSNKEFASKEIINFLENKV